MPWAKKFTEYGMAAEKLAETVCSDLYCAHAVEIVTAFMQLGGMPDSYLLRASELVAMHTGSNVQKVKLEQYTELYIAL